MNIQINNLSFSYGRKEPLVLDGLSLTVEHGSIMVILGLNGSGKTTLIKCLAGLLKPNSGSINYGDKELSNISIKDRSHIFSYVSQKGTAADDILIEDYLLYGMTNSLMFYQMPNESHIEKAKEIAKRFGIEGFLKKKLGEVSGGERQLVGICQALLQDTEVVILDEPLSALDLKNQQLVLSALRDISKEEGKTLIMSDHNPNHALFLNCNAVLMSGGKITKSGHSKEIINLENLKSIYGDNICESKLLEYEEISIR